MRKSYLPLALLILLTAALLRLYGLSTYPPGPHYDEGANILIARSVAFGGAGLEFFPIVPNFQGREILYYYLATPLLYIIPDSHFALQVTSAFLGIITVAAAMGLGRAMFNEQNVRGQQGYVIGLAVGVMAALNFPLIFLARQAFRAVTLPFCQALALLFLWHGLQDRRGLRAKRRDWLWLAVGGFMAGAALYTYMASRLFPLWLLLGGLFILLLDRSNWRLRLRQGVIFFGVLAITALPLVIFAAQNPDTFMGRFSEVTTYGESSTTLTESIVKHARMFFIEGERLLRYNIPKRPYLTLPEGLLLLFGIGVAGWQLLRRKGSALERGALALALLAPLMVIPSVIALGGFPPNHMRSVGMVPLIFVLAAVGFAAVITGLADRVKALTVSRLMVASVLAALLVGGLLVGQAYFTWAGRGDLYYDTDSDLTAAKEWLKEEAGDSTRIYLTSGHYAHPTITSDPSVPPLLWQRDNLLYWPPPDRDGLTIYRRDAEDVPGAWLDWLEPYALDGLPLAPDGAPAFMAYHIPAGSEPPDFGLTEVPADVRNSFVTLLGTSDASVTAGAVGSFTMAWHVLGTPVADALMPIIQIEDELGTVLARVPVEMVETASWLPGETIIQQVAVELPVGIPPGEYLIRVAWVDRGPDEYFSYLDATGGGGRVWATIGSLNVIRPQVFPDPATLDIPQQAAVRLAPGVTLLGWDLPPTLTLAPGEAIGGALFWLAGSDIAADLQYDIVLAGERQEYWLWGGGPVRDTYPTTAWAAGEIVSDQGRWAVPREVKNGPYTLLLRTTGTTLPLAEVTITGQPRVFERPVSTTEAGQLFGDSLLLDGYTQVGEDGALRLELIWQAVEPVAVDYTVFVHVLDEAGNIVAQRDAMPQDNGYPTARWVGGEFVRDGYTFPDLPPGVYQVRLGLYLQADGSRLSVAGDDETIVGDFTLLEPVAVE